MSQSQKNILVIGGGIPGLYSSIRLAKLFPEHHIHLIESGNKVGGLYNSIEDSLAGCFDKGMHIIYETCIKEIDDELRNCLPEEDWIFLEGNHKDLAGLFYKDNIFYKSPYMNIKDAKKETLKDCLFDLFNSLENEAPTFKECNNAREFFEKRFGYTITEELIEPALKKLWRNNSKNLHPAASRIVLMDRICFFSEEATFDLMKSKRIRSRIAYPDQLKLDLSFRNAQRGLYPKKFGLTNFIKNFEKRIKDYGVKIYKDTILDSIKLINNEISSVLLKNNKDTFEINSIELMHSTISPLQMQNLFKITNDYKFDPPLIQKYVFLLLKNPPEMKNIYYFFSFQTNMKIYRVTDYSSYCPDAIREFSGANLKKVWPICVELHYQNKEPSLTEILKDTKKELTYTGVVKEESDIVYTRIENAGGFPILTLNNCKILKDAKDSIIDLNIKNLILAGQAPHEGVFFLHDSLLNVYNLINEYIDKNNKS